MSTEGVGRCRLRVSEGVDIRCLALLRNNVLQFRRGMAGNGIAKLADSRSNKLLLR